MGRRPRRIDRCERDYPTTLAKVVAFAIVTLAALVVIPASLTKADELTGTTDVPFTKYWDDEGYESKRPGSVTFRLYEEDRPNVVVATTTLSASDAVADDAWQGKFSSVPKQRNGQDIAYIVKEDVPEGYIVSYDYGYDGYTFKIKQGTLTASDTSISFFYEGKDGQNRKIYQLDAQRVSSGSYSYGVEQASVLYLPNYSTVYDLSYRRWAEGGSSLASALSSLLSMGDIKYPIECYGTDYPHSIKDYPLGYHNLWSYSANLGRHTPKMYMYIYSSSNGRRAYRSIAELAIDEVTPVRNPEQPIEITDTINLLDYPFTKVWDDAGMENARPRRVTVDIYQDDGTEPYATTVLSASDATDAHTWAGAFRNLPRYSEDGSYREHEYTIRERHVSGYDTTYDSDYLNAVDIQFDENMNLKFWSFYAGDWGKTMFSFTRAGQGWEHGRFYDSEYNGWINVRSICAGLPYTIPGKEIIAEYSPDMCYPTAGSRIPYVGIKALRRVHIDVDQMPTDWYRLMNETQRESYLRTKAGEVENAAVYEMPFDNELHELSPSTSGARSYLHFEWDDSTPFAGADTITNTPNYEAIISKRGMTGEEEVPGARMTLSEKDGDKVDEWVSADSPHLMEPGVLTKGKTYVLHEEGAPDGYAYATDIEFVAGQTDSPDVIVMRDKPTYAEISKVAITGGDELPGASLRVLDAGGGVVDEWVSAETPHAIVGKLVAGGTYVLHEEVAPDGYAVASDVEFAVSLDGTVDKVEMVDEILPVDANQGKGDSPEGEQTPAGEGNRPDASLASEAQASPGSQSTGRGAGGSPLLQTGGAVPIAAAGLTLAGLAGWSVMRARKIRLGGE